MGAPIGNKNGAGRHEWSDAIRKEIVGRKRLKKLVKALVDKAESGDMSAMREVGDRMDGKPAQTIQGPGDDGSFLITLSTDDDSAL